LIDTCWRVDAQAELAGARGVAARNKIVAEGFGGPEEVVGSSNQIVYVPPSDDGLSVLETGAAQSAYPPSAHKKKAPDGAFSILCVSMTMPRTLSRNSSAARPIASLIANARAVPKPILSHLEVRTLSRLRSTCRIYLVTAVGSDLTRLGNVACLGDLRGEPVEGRGELLRPLQKRSVAALEFCHLGVLHLTNRRFRRRKRINPVLHRPGEKHGHIERDR
jgi:hypothetical protein